jgi:hypothetical protein
VARSPCEVQGDWLTRTSRCTGVDAPPRQAGTRAAVHSSVGGGLVGAWGGAGRPESPSLRDFWHKNQNCENLNVSGCDSVNDFWFAVQLLCEFARFFLASSTSSSLWK